MQGSASCRFAVVVVVAASFVNATLARAQESPTDPAEAEVCFSAAERAQPLMKQRRLREARSELEVCARDVCPRLARTDCRQWLGDVTRATPTIVIAPHELRGADDVREARGVRAVIDGAIVIDPLDATPIPVDPGTHKLHLEHAGAAPLDEDVDVHEGDKGRIIDVYWRMNDPIPVPSRPVPASVFVAGGLGALAIGLGTYFEIAGLTRRSDLDRSCKPTRTCAQSDVDAAHNFTRAGDATLGAGVLFLAGATYFFLTRPTRPAAATSESAQRGRATFLIEPLPGGFLAGVGGIM